LHKTTKKPKIWTWKALLGFIPALIEQVSCCVVHKYILTYTY